MTSRRPYVHYSCVCRIFFCLALGGVMALLSLPSAMSSMVFYHAEALRLFQAHQTVESYREDKPNTPAPAHDTANAQVLFGMSERDGFEKISLSFTPVVLNPDNSSEDMVGELVFLKGWHLTSEHERFGGFSGLDINGQHFVAITDRGDWLVADFDASKADPLSAVRMAAFGGQSNSNKKADLDAEDLLRVKDGYLVSFEHDHRIEHISAPGAPSATRMQALDKVDLSWLSSNHGIEALGGLTENRLLLFAEQGRDWRGRLPVFDLDIVQGTHKKRGYQVPDFHAPTAATRLQDGSLLIVNRRYSPLSGQSIKLVHISAFNAFSDQLLAGREVASLTSPLTVDNFEALSVIGYEQGKPVIALLSDDNFSPLQRTLLLIFRFEGYRRENMELP